MPTTANIDEMFSEQVMAPPARKSRKNSSMKEDVYENPTEANMRLSHTIVKYKSDYYYILCCAPNDNKSMKVYMEPLSKDGYDSLESRREYVPYNLERANSSTWEGVGKAMDKYMKDNPNTRIIRKLANSRYFDRFRPFPLGFINDARSGDCIFLSRMPQRSVLQGLSDKSLNARTISFMNSQPSSSSAYSLSRKPYIFGLQHLNSPAGLEMLHNKYPSPSKAYEMVCAKPASPVSAVAFHKYFAFALGPLDTVFLFYKQEPVGFVSSDLSIELPKSKSQYVEMLNESNLFSTITVKE